jgi:PIN domain nuclease of toxin-antitoxin system
MSGPFILDTCACLWLVSGELSAGALAAITDALNVGVQTFVSPITALEVGTLARKRRLTSPLSPQKWFRRLTNLPGIEVAEMSPDVLIESALLPNYPNKDPYDRIIAATAREYGYTVLTRDRALLDYAQKGYLSALAC